MPDNKTAPLTNADTKRHRMADAVVAFQLSGDAKKTAAEANISERTLARWCALVTEDPKLAELVGARKARVVQGVSDELPAALKAAISFLRKAATDGDHKNPKVIEAVAKSLETLNEVAVTWKVLEQRFPDAGVPADRKDRPVPAQARPAVASGGSAGTASAAQH